MASLAIVVAPLALVVGLTATACTATAKPQTHSSAAPIASHDTPAPIAGYATPAATVTAYYQALERHDGSAALALLAPKLAKEYTAAGPGGELENIVRLDHLRDVKSAPAAAGTRYPGYVDITQVVATYDVIYRQEIASANGTQIRFVYVGRTGPSAPWRILEIGTGP